MVGVFSGWMDGQMGHEVWERLCCRFIFHFCFFPFLIGNDLGNSWFLCAFPQDLCVSPLYARYLRGYLLT